MVLRLLDEVLRTAGYHVLTADGGWSAIEAYEALGAPIHLLLTDVIMPDLTGPVLAERLRSRQPDLQVLFISGFHDADLVQRFASDKGFSLLPSPSPPMACSARSNTPFAPPDRLQLTPQLNYSSVHAGADHHRWPFAR